ncbi:hypothetical protein F4083_08540 [Candidatus Poribacteria bacterium]|nr:hypothetical protein [Candidatus Poribacteria bacterium]
MSKLTSAIDDSIVDFNMKSEIFDTSQYTSKASTRQVNNGTLDHFLNNPVQKMNRNLSISLTEPVRNIHYRPTH